MDTSKKIDLFRQLTTDYKQAKKPILFQSTPGQYLAINGSGKPGCVAFQQAVAALYSMAFTAKMTRKAAGLGDYVVCKLEALWWAEGNVAISQVDQDLWQWKLMIRTPDCVSKIDLHSARQALQDKGKASGVEKIVMEIIDEGYCVQMLHVGPYEKEHETIGTMQAFMFDHDVKPLGHHHEIYVSDPRRIKPERLKTILRQPVG
jgi:hypothetical protein